MNQNFSVRLVSRAASPNVPFSKTGLGAELGLPTRIFTRGDAMNGATVSGLQIALAPKTVISQNLFGNTIHRLFSLFLNFSDIILLKL